MNWKRREYLPEAMGLIRYTAVVPLRELCIVRLKKQLCLFKAHYRATREKNDDAAVVAFPNPSRKSRLRCSVALLPRRWISVLFGKSIGSLAFSRYIESDY